ncbi:hypothetical protein HPB49_016051 [Dermacentor silvarum]|uniref:Uncharacterized protein n=1 Tax=Dermacentor silvarum TaxID=543639 RepID=A0ACB8CYH8_DERSI|nr:hypothetical protein HPB49_016051 [Dermacentor silvarum]
MTDLYVHARKDVFCFEVPAQYVSCPDGCYCSAGTCCPDSAGGYRCCPYEHGVCCSDRESCCSRGQSCEVSNKTCVDDNYSYSYSVATVQNVPAHAVAPKHVKPSVNGDFSFGAEWPIH